jgi:hypothetical protein
MSLEWFMVTKDEMDAINKAGGMLGHFIIISQKQQDMMHGAGLRGIKGEFDPKKIEKILEAAN